MFYQKMLKWYPKRAMPLDTPFRIKNAYNQIDNKEYLLNASNPEMEELALYCRKSPNEPWEIICKNQNCDDEFCLVKNQEKYRFLFNWKDKIEYEKTFLKSVSCST